MRWTTVFTVLFLVVAAGASAHRGAPAWDEARAEHVTAGVATLQVPPVDREALVPELRSLVARFRALELFATDEGDHRAASRAHNLRYRYSTVLRAVLDGIPLVSAACDGQGSPVRIGRFGHFRCEVTSEPLTIPSVELRVVDGGTLPSILEKPPRRLGPNSGRLLVHVTGPASLAYSQATASVEAVVGTATGMSRA